MMERVLPRNENGFDRGARVLVGIAALSLVFVGPQTLWGLLGIVPLATGLIGSCPLYTLFGIGTCPVKQTTTA